MKHSIQHGRRELAPRAAASQTRVQRSMQKRRRRTQWRRRRSEKWACSDTIEESSSSPDEADARRKGARYYKESSPCSFTHNQSDTSLHLHITTWRMHHCCSHDTWCQGCASVRNLRLKPEVSPDLCEPSPALALLNSLSHGGYAVFVWEKRNIWVRPHTTETMQQQNNASPASAVSTLWTQ